LAKIPWVLQSSVDEWKASREIKKLKHRAEKAEDYAARSVYLALAMMEEAEAAILMPSWRVQRLPKKRTLMSKEKKGNKETKKPKAPPDETKKQKKDPKRYDGKP
jgi:hypothetical protein